MKTKRKRQENVQAELPRWVGVAGWRTEDARLDVGASGLGQRGTMCHQGFGPQSVGRGGKADTRPWTNLEDPLTSIPQSWDPLPWE